MHSVYSYEYLLVLKNISNYVYLLYICRVAFILVIELQTYEKPIGNIKYITII